MENFEITGHVYELEEERWSTNNMMCIVTYEPLPAAVQAEIEAILAVAE